MKRDMNKNPFFPKINRITSRFSSRDALGIESVATSISGELCPIVNTVTPRAFYWPFLCWIYYDFYKNSGIKEWKTDVFDRGFLKRQDYYFVLANLLADNPDQMNLVGKQKTAVDKANNPNGPYAYNPDYFITRFGGMQYYNAGCLTMHLITDYNDETGETYAFPRLTQLGEEMALAFESVIKDTVYYKQYRLINIPIPKDVLVEYGSVIQLNLKTFKTCKDLLRKHLFERNRQLYLCSEYAKKIYSIAQKHDLTAREARYLLYDYYSSHGEGNVCPEDLHDTVLGWEIVIGRQYFSAGIEMIWKYMLQALSGSGSMSKEVWFDTVFKGIPAITLKSNVEDLLATCIYSHNTREQMVSLARSSLIKPDTVINGLMLALSVYNRFKDRDDLGNAFVFLDYGRGRIPGTGAISINEWISLVDQFKKQSVNNFLLYVMSECIVEQHKRTCFEKITRSTQSVDGFYFEYIDGLYIKNEHVFQVDFQGNRFIQLMQVMQDLNMFKG